MYCDFMLRNVRVNIGGVGGVLAVYMKNLENGAFAWLWENPPLVGNETTFVVSRNILPAINIGLSESDRI